MSAVQCIEQYWNWPDCSRFSTICLAGDVRQISICTVGVFGIPPLESDLLGGGIGLDVVGQIFWAVAIEMQSRTYVLSNRLDMSSVGVFIFLGLEDNRYSLRPGHYCKLISFVVCRMKLRF